MSLGKNCRSANIVMHEMMHALGFLHEQSRPDRDDYVTIMLDNIKEGDLIHIILTYHYINSRLVLFVFV